MPTRLEPFERRRLLTGTLSGTLFNDVNANGREDAGEGAAGGAGVSVYLDLNHEAKPDSGDAFANGGGGTYTFPKPSGRYVHGWPVARCGRAPDRAGHAQRHRVRRTTTTADFPVQVLKSVFVNLFLDSNRNGAYDSGEHVLSPNQATIYADLNEDGRLDSGDLTRPTDGTDFYVPTGTHTIRIIPDSDSVVTTAAAYSVTTTQNVTPVPAFGIAPADGSLANAQIQGTAFTDANGNAVYDTGDTPAIGRTVFLDTNGNGQRDGGEFVFVNLARGTYHVREILPTGRVASTPPLDLTLSLGQQAWHVQLGDKAAPPPSYTVTLSGFAFDDRNKNGKYDSGETKTGGKTVFLDANNNGVLDGGETSVVTGSNGTWFFGGLAAGTYHVRRAFPPGYTYSTAPIDLNAAAGQTVAGLAIGSVPAAAPPPTSTASITGLAFDDNNRDGRFDTGDKYTPGKTVFLDANNDGVLDDGEVSVLTDATGKFSFTHLSAGTYHVRRVFVSGYTYSTVKIDLTLKAGQAVGGLVIGTKKA